MQEDFNNQLPAATEATTELQSFCCSLRLRKWPKTISEVIEMTEKIICHAGICKDKIAFLDECENCSITEQIEHDLFAEDIKIVYMG